MPIRENLPHLVIPDRRTETRPYTYPKPVVVSAQLPPRNAAQHGAKLQSDLTAVKGAKAGIDGARAALGMLDEQGMILEFTVEPGLDLALDKFDRAGGIQLVTAVERNGAIFAAVFVPEGKLAVFEKLVEQYRTETTKRGQPKNNEFGASVREIRVAVIETLWTDSEALPPPVQPIWWEVWLRHSPTAVADFSRLAAALQIDVGPESLEFVDRVVVLAFATVEKMASSVGLLDAIAELRRAKDLAGFFTGLPPREQGQWVAALAQQTARPAADALAVCLLDTGVNRGHPLLEVLLAPADLHTVDEVWGRADHHGHGTEMAGLAAWGDLTPTLAGNPSNPTHVLESVVLLSPTWVVGTPPELYGKYTAAAVALPEIAAPERDRVFCMTVTTTDFRDRGRPSSWSAEVDTLCHGGRDEKPRLLVISAGNLMPQDRWKHWIDANDVEQVHDPAQAWNALTVGASTEKSVFDQAVFPGHLPIATPGSLSPSSTTSVTWASSWPTKPDVVIEGGNATISPGGDVDLPDDLRLLTTYWQPLFKPLITTGDTSGAAALVARMAATIWTETRDRWPAGDMWPEMVRALVVHSARWTPAMLRTYPAGAPKSAANVLLRRFGWGVPDLRRATTSATNALTLLAQRSLSPFQNTAGANKVPDIKTKDWHLYKLPWPAAALRAIGAATVELRVTLSYYIEPNPARRGWRSRNRYQSAGLRFAMQKPTEPLDEFRARMSKNDQDEERGLPSFADPQWTLGPGLRDRGSIHSDIWTGSGVDLAEREHLAIYPVGGWWRERAALGRYDHPVRYALAVSILAPDVGVDIYTPVAIEIGVPIEI